MGILLTIIVGFLVGLVARFIKPGKDNMGFMWTTLIGIGGAFLAAFIGQGLGWYVIGEPAGFLAAVLGAVLLLVIVQAVMGRKTVSI